MHKMKNNNPFKPNGVVGRMSYLFTRLLNVILFILPALIIFDDRSGVEPSLPIGLLGLTCLGAFFVFDFFVTRKRLRDIEGKHYEELWAYLYTIGCYIPIFGYIPWGILMIKKGGKYGKNQLCSFRHIFN